jgi:hypothetical protein
MAHSRHGLTMGRMAKKFPLHPAHPERTCWGCDKYCPVTELQCGNGSERTQHPEELFGPDWHLNGLDPVTKDEGEALSAPGGTS